LKIIAMTTVAPNIIIHLPTGNVLMLRMNPAASDNNPADNITGYVDGFGT
jgi:hypothetical protein